MVFSSEKKELWRYASRNRNGSGKHQLPITTQTQTKQIAIPTATTMCTTTMLPPNYYADRLNNSQLQHQQQQHQEHQQEEENDQHLVNYNIPPPPYCSVPCGIDCVDVCRTSLNEEDHFSFGGMSNVGNTTTDCQCLCKSNVSLSNNDNNNFMDISQTNDCYKYNYSNKSKSPRYNCNDDCIKCNQHRTITNKKATTGQLQSSSPPPPTTTINTTPIVTTASVLAATAVSIFRNCCGGSGTATTTSTASLVNHNNNDILLVSYSARHYFDALLKQLKDVQVTALLKAVKSRLELVPSMHQSYCCILVQRALILNEEPHVIACRLFFWHDLLNASELKRVPHCPSESDPIYVCCNPLHWFRILRSGIQNYKIPNVNR